MDHSKSLLCAIFLTALAAATPGLQAQDIFLFDLERSGGDFTLTNGKNLTEREGYDNQPFFTSDSTTVLFASQRDGDNDVFEYVMETGKIRQLTHTPDTPEYSPMPNQENTHFTVVRENTVPDQTVWRVGRDSGESKWALHSREPIGYYMFNQRGEALVWIRYAYIVQLVRPLEGESIFISGHAAPSTPKLVPGTESFSFVHRQVNGESWIKKLDPATLSVTPVAPLVGTQIYYGWTMEGTLLTARGSTLLHWDPEVSREWEEVADLSPFGLRDITRLMVSPDGSMIAIVAADAGSTDPN